jgi:hypothetical protein
MKAAAHLSQKNLEIFNHKNYVKDMRKSLLQEGDQGKRPSNSHVNHEHNATNLNFDPAQMHYKHNDLS